MKLSELNGRLLTIEQKVDTLLASNPSDPDVPADAEATIVRLEDKLANVSATPPTEPPTT